MDEIKASRDDRTNPSSTRSPITRFVREQFPFIVALVLSIAGVAYTNASRQPLVGYWEFLAVAIGVASVINNWSQVDNKEARWQLIWTQSLHWIAVLVAMNILLLSGVRQLLPTPAISLVLLTLLALGTFLAGVSLLSLQTAFLGLAMGAAVPVISWLKQSVFFLLAAVFLIGLGITFWLRNGAGRDDASADSKNQMRVKSRMNRTSRDHLRICIALRHCSSRACREVQGRQTPVRQHTTRGAGPRLERRSCVACSTRETQGGSTL